MKLLLITIVRHLVLRQEITACHVWLIHIRGAHVHGRVEIVDRG